MAYGVSHKGSRQVWQLNRTAQQIEATGDALTYFPTKEERLAFVNPETVGRVFCQDDTGELFLYVSAELEPAEERWVQVQITLPVA